MLYIGAMNDYNRNLVPFLPYWWSVSGPCFWALFGPLFVLPIPTFD